MKLAARARRVVISTIALAAALGIAAPVHALSPAPQPDVGLFHLDGSSADSVVELERALHRELITRGLTQSEIASLSELRLTMGCKQLEPACLGRGGRALGLRRMVVGDVKIRGGDLEVHLQVVLVGEGKAKANVAIEAIDVLVAEDLAAANLDETAARLVDQIFPGTAIATAPPPAMPLEAEATETDEPAPRPSRESNSDKAPRWQRIGLGTSGGVTGLFAVIAIATKVSLNTRLRQDLLDAVDESTQDGNEENDIAREEKDLCAAGRESPMNDGKVRNAKVTRICNKADGVYKILIGSLVIASVGAAATVVFGSLMIASKLRRRNNVVWAPILGPRTIMGASVSGRF